MEKLKCNSCRSELDLSNPTILSSTRIKVVCPSCGKTQKLSRYREPSGYKRGSHGGLISPKKKGGKK